MITKETCSMIAIILGLLCSAGLSVFITSLIKGFHNTLGKDKVNEDDFNAIIDIKIYDPYSQIPNRDN